MILAALFKTRSKVIRDALYLLQQAQLEAFYQEANQEIDDAFEITALDGLDEDETKESGLQKISKTQCHRSKDYL